MNEIILELSAFGISLYCLVDSKLTRIGTDGTVTKVSDRMMDN